MDRYYLIIREDRAARAAAPSTRLDLDNRSVVTVNSPDIADAQEVCRALIASEGGTWLIFRLQQICTPDMDITTATP